MNHAQYSLLKKQIAGHKLYKSDWRGDPIESILYKTEIMLIERMKTSVSDNKEGTPGQKNSPKSPKTVVKVSHQQEMKQTDLILVQPET